MTHITTCYSKLLVNILNRTRQLFRVISRNLPQAGICSWFQAHLVLSRQIPQYILIFLLTSIARPAPVGKNVMRNIILVYSGNKRVWGWSSLSNSLVSILLKKKKGGGISGISNNRPEVASQFITNSFVAWADHLKLISVPLCLKNVNINTYLM